ncbi:MAG: SGNH/GDSL hydrolase family protein [Lapillicoccus sp.]
MLRPLAAALALATLVLPVLTGCAAPPAPAGPEGVLATITTPPTSASTSASTSTSAGAGPSASTASAPADGWYLALGDSLAAGRQPTTGDQPTRGYAGPVLAGLQQNRPGTALKNLGCSGETTGSMLRGGLCRYPEGNQVAAATAFLTANPGRVPFVTLDIGANNVLRCATPAIDQACATSSTTAAANDLATILSRLRAAAPQATIVVLTYYNPLLAAYRQSPAGQQLAAQSQPLLADLNRAVAAAGTAVGAKVADVAGAFATTTTTGSPEPTNVARICAWTWMCTRNDIHANDDGYAAMARAVLAAR